MLADDVVLDLAGAAADGGGKGVEIGSGPDSIVHSVLVADIIGAMRPGQGDGELIDPPDEFCVHQFARQGQARRVVLVQGRNRDPLAAKLQALNLQDEVDHLAADVGIVERRRAVPLHAFGQIQDRPGVGRGLHIAARLPAPRAALVFQGPHGDLPAVALGAHQSVGGNSRVGEEGLGEAVLSGQLADRRRGDARHFHRRQQE